MQRSEVAEPSPQFAPSLEAAYGALSFQVLSVAVELGIAERLAQDGPSAAIDLAPKLGIQALTLERILRGLVSVGVCEELAQGMFRLTSRGEYLRPQNPASVEPRIRLNAEIFYRLWGCLTQTVLTGEGGSVRALGLPFQEYLAKEPRAGAIFDAAMAGEAATRHRPAVQAYDFDRCNTIVDVGGGNGALVAEILLTYPRPNAIILDLPRMEKSAQQTISARGLENRCRFVGGDAFEAVPAGADTYIFSNFLAGWGDDQAVIALQNCRRSMAAHGSLLLIEWVMPTGSRNHSDLHFFDTVMRDLIMLSVFGSEGARVRTEAGFRDLLAAARFDLTAVIPTSGSISVIQARPA
jgi:O-methyltransferase domain